MASVVVKGDLIGVVRGGEERDFIKRQVKQFVCEGTPHGLLKVLQNSGWGGVFLKHLKVVNLKGYNTLLDVSNYTFLKTETDIFMESILGGATLPVPPQPPPRFAGSKCQLSVS